MIDWNPSSKAAGRATYNVPAPDIWGWVGDVDIWGWVGNLEFGWVDGEINKVLESAREVNVLTSNMRRFLDDGRRMYKYFVVYNASRTYTLPSDVNGQILMLAFRANPHAVEAEKTGVFVNGVRVSGGGIPLIAQSGLSLDITVRPEPDLNRLKYAQKEIDREANMVRSFNPKDQNIYPGLDVVLTYNRQFEYLTRYFKFMSIRLWKKKIRL